MKCSNCETNITPLWRRGVNGSYLCNACGLYYKIHQSNRPKELKTETFRHRHRIRKSESFAEYNHAILKKMSTNKNFEEEHASFIGTLHPGLKNHKLNQIGRCEWRNNRQYMEELELIAAEALIRLSRDTN